jgi:argonaute-like protein implicated in RNA metabolism and viral defense
MKDQASPQLTAAIMETVNNQLRDSNPPEAKETYDRLVASGISDKEARRLIAIVLSNEMFEILKNKEPYNQQRYIAFLRKLPKLPWDTSK